MADELYSISRTLMEVAFLANSLMRPQVQNQKKPNSWS
jgi:hypothetical protein